MEWWLKQMLAGKPILLNTLSDLPRVARQESEILAMQNIKVTHGGSAPEYRTGVGIYRY